MSDRDYDGEVMSNWTLLSNATVADVETLEESLHLEEYHNVLKKYEKEQEKISEIVEMTRFLMLEAGDHKEMLKVLGEQEKSAYQHSIAILHELLELESTKPIQDILAREREKAFARAKQENQEVLATYRSEVTAHQQEVTKQVPSKKQSIKDALIERLGGLGFILYFVLRLIIAILPFVMIGANFFVTLLLISINYFVPFTSVVFWIWGLVCAIKGVQDVWAIMYYVVFSVVWLPFFIRLMALIFSKK